jgi:hypothetical protein
MSKRLLIPVLAFTVAAIGCSSSAINATDGGAGNTGTAGSGGATAGAGGSTGGSDADAADTDAGAAGADGGLIPPSCLAEDWSPSMFCMILLGFCGNANPGYTTMAECMTTYAAVGVATPNKQLCESEHLCNAANDTGDDRTLHCSHAVGLGDECTQTN